MKNLSKKLLACCLAICMVLTLCVGALTVSADVTDNYVKVGSVEVTTEEKAVVPVSILSTGGIAAAEINVSVPNLTISKLELVTTDTNVVVTYANAADPTGAPIALDKLAMSSEVAPNIIDNVFTYIVHLPANTVTTAEVTLNITFGALAVGTYDITVDTESCKDSTSDLLTLEEIDGAIKVTEAVAPHEHAYTYEHDDEGHWQVCSNEDGLCDAVTTEKVAHDYGETGTCVCGAEEVTEIVPVEDASIVVRDVGVLITETLDMQVRVRKTVIPADCARAEIVVTPTIYDGSYNPTSGTVFTESFDMATASNNLIIYPENFSLYALDLPMYVQIKCYDADDNYYKYSPVYTYYPADTLKAQYNESASTDSLKKLNSIVTDMLNMSAAAQTYFASNAGATSTLKATVNAGNLVNKDWPQTYATITEPDYNTIDIKTYGEGFNSTNNELRIGADLSGAPILSYSLRKASTAYPDRSKLSMTISYTTYYGKAAGGEVVSDTIEGSEWDQYVSGNHLLYNFKDCAMYDGNKTVTVVVNYDGAEVVRSEYSLETYIAANSAGDTVLAKCLKSLGIFGASARAYFSTLGTVDPA